MGEGQSFSVIGGFEAGPLRSKPGDGAEFLSAGAPRFRRWAFAIPCGPRRKIASLSPSPPCAHALPGCRVRWAASVTMALG
jgi:hypothetical protein